MLTPEDTLRLNVLISTCEAIRVDVYKLVVIGLTKDKKEQAISLNPDGDSSKYIQAVQKLLVSKVLGSMGGYPSYLKRWSRMGQVSSSNLGSLLKIGNIEAVVAVANSQNLDDEVLELVWWCATNFRPTSRNWPIFTYERFCGEACCWQANRSLLIRIFTFYR